MLIPILSSFKLIRITFCTGELLFAPVFKYGKISSCTLLTTFKIHNMKQPIRHGRILDFVLGIALSEFFGSLLTDFSV